MDKYITFEEGQEMFSKRHKFWSWSEYEGIILHSEAARAADDFKTWEVRDSDVWIVTYPKAGTTWTQEIVSAVMHDGILDALTKRHSEFRVPYLDGNLPEAVRRSKNLPRNTKIAEEIPSPRVLKSHLPGHLLPPQLWEKKPKIVYVIRNPKDLVVSFFFFIKLLDPQFVDQPFGAFFNDMLTGKAPFGPWWDHYLYFWKKRHDENVLLLRFEDMKKDLREAVEKISKFLGKNLSAENLDAITDHCTFANMKKNPMASPDSLLAKRDVPTSDFMRKGKVGDWKSYFTVAQNEDMDALIRDKLRGTGLTFDDQ